MIQTDMASSWDDDQKKSNLTKQSTVHHFADSKVTFERSSDFNYDKMYKKLFWFYRLGKYCYDD